MSVSVTCFVFAFVKGNSSTEFLKKTMAFQIKSSINGRRKCY